MSWGELYALFCVETGWTWEYVDEEMTLPRCDGFVEMWKHNLPVRTTLSIIAQCLGMKAPATAAPAAQKGNIGDLLGDLAGAGIHIEDKRGRR